MLASMALPFSYKLSIPAEMVIVKSIDIGAHK